LLGLRNIRYGAPVSFLGDEGRRSGRGPATGNMQRRIVCVGTVLSDNVYRLDRPLGVGLKMPAVAFEARFGGPGATAAVAIASLGGAAAFWGCVGADAIGAQAIDELQRHGVDCGGVVTVPGGRTRSAVVLVDGNGERTIVAYRAGLPQTAQYLTTAGLGGADLVLADSRWGAGAEAVMDRARAARIPIVVDLDGGERGSLTGLVGKAHHVVFSTQGLRDFAGDGEPADALRACAAEFGRDKVYAVTQGADGSFWLVGDAVVHVPAFAVAVADTTGCGDVFHGAYALAIAEGEAPLAAARFASAMAALKAARGDGWNGMADRVAVLEFMAANAT
jgi:sulfofructose kinase